MAATVLIVNRSRIARDAIARALDAAQELSVISAHRSSRDALPHLAGRTPDVVVIDFSEPDIGLSIRAVIDAAPRTLVVVSGVTVQEAEVVACARAGAAGYIDAEASEPEWIASIMGAACGEVHHPKVAGILNRHLQEPGRGEPPSGDAPSAPSWRVRRSVAESAERAGLTPRERQILGLIDEGLSNKEIANALHVELSTIKNHVHAILGKYGVRRRTQAAARFRRAFERR